MSDLIPLTKVYIIESPSFMDILDNRKEGLALSKILDLAKIENEVFGVSNIETFELALERIAKNVLEIRSKLGMVQLHFSLHGSNEGIALSDNTFLNWGDFYTLIKKFNETIEYIKAPNGVLFAPTYLIFSVCNGFSAKIIKEFDETSPYTALVGPVRAIEWSDALLAYSTFYHNTLLKKMGLPKAIENMNSVVGLENVFQFDMGKGMKII
jgi:hypothetical protein